MFAWGIGFSTFYHDHGVLWLTLEALDKVFPMDFPFGDEARLVELTEGFHNDLGGVLYGSVMAIDGFVVSTHAAFQSEVETPKDYHFQKPGFAIIVLAGVHGWFLCASCNHSGSTDNIITWQDMNSYDVFELQKLLYFFIGDEVFLYTQ
jgi:hypothetical protein